MKINSIYFSLEKYILIAINIIVFCFLLLRSVNINADFPQGITTSWALYTDEGWYANSAIRHYLTGEWYLEEDINFAITQPGAQIIYRLAFSLLGMSISSARMTIVVAFVLLTIVLAVWVRKYYGDLAALLSALVLSTNYFAFAYSRLALRFLIALLFILASFWAVESKKDKKGFIKIIIASLLLVYGVLTYSPAIFALPLLVFLVWKNGRSTKEKSLFVVGASLVIILTLGSYYALILKLYPTDVKLLAQVISGSFVTNFSEWVMNLLRKIIVCIKVLGVDLSIVTGLLTFSAFILSKRFRRNTLVQVMLGYCVIYIAVLSIDIYGPPRYYLLLLVPFAGLCSIATLTVMNWLREQHQPQLALLPMLLVVITSAHGSWNIITYLSHPDYSFYQMTHGIKKIIEAREETTNGVILFGDIADSVALEIGAFPVNSGLWTLNLVDSRLREYLPDYLIVHTTQLAQTAEAEGAVVTELGRWEVFKGYYPNDQPVRLYHAAWPEGGGP